MRNRRKVPSPAKGVLHNIESDPTVSDEQSLQGYLEDKHKREASAAQRLTQPGGSEPDLEDIKH